MSNLGGEIIVGDWYSVSCEDCGAEIRVCEDWSHVPRFCRACKEEWAAGWREKTCAVCGELLRYRADWDREPLAHKACWSAIAPKDMLCSECGGSFRVGTRFQLQCRENGLGLPTRCFECRHDELLIKGAVGALRDHVAFPLEATIEQRGVLFTDKVAVVRNRRTGEVVAEVTMKERGILSVERIAVTADKRGGASSEIAQTRDGSRGIFFPERTADTYRTGSDERTHRTREVDRGIIFRERLARTERESGGSRAVETRERTKGMFFPRRSIVSDRA